MLDIVLMLLGEILSWSLMGVQGLTRKLKPNKFLILGSYTQVFTVYNIFRVNIEYDKAVLLVFTLCESWLRFFIYFIPGLFNNNYIFDWFLSFHDRSNHRELFIFYILCKLYYLNITILKS